MKTIIALACFLFMAIVVSACAPDAEPAASNPTPPATEAISATPTVSLPTLASQIDFVSNSEIRSIPLSADLMTAVQIDIPLAGKPTWIAGVPFESGSAWAVALEDGRLQAFLVTADGYTPSAISPDRLSQGAPLTVYSKNGELFALVAADASLYSAAVVLDPLSSKIAYIAANGDLVIRQEDQETRLPVDALPDSRILADGNGSLLLLSNPVDRYTHSVLGDGLEAAGITLVETEPEPRIAQIIAISEPDVIEGIYPIWADMDGDGLREIIVTLSNAQSGARIVAFREGPSTGSGQAFLLAEGPPVGTGFRWRHQLVVAPFGEGSENLLAVVRTPHIGGVLEFYRLQGNELEIVAEIPGISTHTIGSRNLFTALAGDFDKDGEAELLAPDQSHTRLGIVGMDGKTTWLDLEADLITNLAAVDSASSSQLVIAAGLANNSLRLWLP